MTTACPFTVHNCIYCLIYFSLICSPHWPACQNRIRSHAKLSWWAHCPVSLCSSDHSGMVSYSLATVVAVNSSARHISTQSKCLNFSVRTNGSLVTNNGLPLSAHNTCTSSHVSKLCDCCIDFTLIWILRVLCSQTLLQNADRSSIIRLLIKLALHKNTCAAEN